MKKIIIYTVGLIIISGASFFGAKVYTDSVYGEPNLASGQKLYNTNCAVCHGSKGLGDGVASNTLAVRPDNIFEELVNPFGFKYELISSVLDGDNGQDGLMPAFKGILTEKEVNDILEHVRHIN
ncbi:c-type cytochrome [Vibrio hippocampi]|uniref:Cytochrome c domain-containing protein n=1 Tax=Vibrio hippocampi TaxID=654686 RepID=A0ABM8ZPK4_9VIBR|nr:cytochrome c [Vibrio hippocampi]CAH0530007.1 hypothetical protein VHP8226_03733 [Vibrio hippocampi]